MSETRSGRTHRVAVDRFAHETVDDEVIVIDMDEGNYFSMRGSAAAIWQLAVDGHAEAAIVDALAAAAPATPRQQIEAGVTALLGELAAEAILVVQDGDAAAPAPGPIELPEGYAAPVLDKYTEMQDLLTLDPIHDVDETGWPRRREDSA